jgi:hypothetical protein
VSAEASSKCSASAQGHSAGEFGEASQEEPTIVSFSEIYSGGDKVATYSKRRNAPETAAPKRIYL